MDSHVQEGAAARQKELERGWVRVPRVRAELLDPAQLARVDERLGPLVAGVEAAHEPNLDRDASLVPEIDDTGRLGEVLGDRLLRPDRLAGAQRGLDQRCMCGGRRHDHDRVDGGVLDRLLSDRQWPAALAPSPDRGSRLPRPDRPRRRPWHWGWRPGCADASGPSDRHQARQPRCCRGPSLRDRSSPSPCPVVGLPGPAGCRHRHLAALGALGLQFMSHWWSGSTVKCQARLGPAMMFRYQQS